MRKGMGSRGSTEGRGNGIFILLSWEVETRLGRNENIRGMDYK
jgi:hypothetical protein